MGYVASQSHASAIQYGDRTFATQARVLSPTPAHAETSRIKEVKETEEGCQR